jgi:hypothetical protein
MKLFHRPAWSFQYAHIYYFSPVLYKVYGSARCQDPPGVTCTPKAVSAIGDFTSSGMATRFLLNVTGTGTGGGTSRGTAKATTPTSLGPGTFPTQNGNASYVATKLYYLHTIHPWTTGRAVVYNPWETPAPIAPRLRGYDTSLGGADITVTHIYTSAMFNYNSTAYTYSTTYPQQTHKQYLKGVTRIVSMVRPRLVHAYASKPTWWPFHQCQEYYTWRPRGVPPAGGRCAQAAQLFTMKVFFLPEPEGLLLLAAGLGCLVVLHRLNRRG